MELKTRGNLILTAALAMAGSGAAFADEDRQYDRGGPHHVRVDCDHQSPRSLQKAIDQKQAGRALVISLRGTCHENITITESKISIIGSGDGAAIVGEATAPVVTVDGATGIHLENLTVSGGLRGLLAQRGAAAHLHDFAANDNPGKALTAGIAVRNASALTASGDIGCSRNGGRGLDVDRSSSWESIQPPGPNIDCSDNGAHGIEIRLGGSFVHEGGTITASRNDGDGIEAHGLASVYLSSTSVTLEENKRRGLEILFGSSVHITGPTAALEVHDNLTEGIGVWNGGRLSVFGPATLNVSGNKGFAGVFLGGSSSFTLEQGPTVKVSNHPNGFGTYLHTNSTLAAIIGASINIESSGLDDLAVFGDSVVLADFGGVINITEPANVVDSLTRGDINVVP